MQLVLVVALVLHGLPAAYSGSGIRATCGVYSSPSGELLIRKQADLAGEAEHHAAKSVISVFRYDEKTTEYRRVEKFLIDGDPDEIFINDTGSHIVTIGDSRAGAFGPRLIAIYSRKGELLRQWALRDLYSLDEIFDPKKPPNFRMVGGAIAWRGDAGWIHDQRELWIGRPVSRVDIADDGTVTHVFGGENWNILVNLDALEIRKQANFKIRNEPDRSHK